MSSRSHSTRTGALRICAALFVVLALSLASACAGTITITIDGKATTVPAGTTAGDLVSKGLVSARKGDVIAAKTHSVVTTGAGMAPVVTVNGKVTTSSQALATGDVVTAVKGADAVEKLVSRTETYAGPVELVGVGSTRLVIDQGKPGVRAVRAGAVSGQIVEETVTAAATPRVVLKVKPATGNKIVALTFDDGPDDVNTPKILKILEENGVKATFFEMGSQVKKHPDLTRELVAAGMVVGNHSYSHPDLKRISTAAGEADIRRAQNAITSAAGSAPRYFRPPGGVMTTALMPVIAAMGLTKVMWTSDTYDWNDPPSIAIVHRALKRARDGGVILMHDGGGDRARTIAALPLVIRALKAEGYTMVTVDKLKRLPQKLGGF